MEVTTTPRKLGNSGYMIQNLGPDTVYVGESTVDEDTGIRLLSGEGLTVGDTSWDVYVVSEGTSDVFTLGKVQGFYSPPAAPAEPPDLTGYVTKASYDANTMLVAHTDNTPVAVTISTNQVVGRGNSGNVKGLTPAETVAIIGAETFTQPQGSNAQTVDYTLVAADAGKRIDMNKASGVTLTVPQDSAATIAIGTYVDVYQLGAGQVTVQAGSGATLRVSGLTAKARAQYSRLGLQKVSANTWSLFGDLAAS